MCRWGRGEAETESLILWLVVLQLLAGGWWLREAQSLIQGWLVTYFVYLALRMLALGMGQIVRLGKRNTLCCKSRMEMYLFGFMIFLFSFMNVLFFIFALIIFVVGLQNRQVMVTSLGRCCWSDRRVLQSPN